MTRVDPETGACPDGTTACTPITEENKENAVCYPEAELETSCPITEILVVDAAGKDALDTEEYTVLTITEDEMYLAYSKTATSMPLSLTYVGAEAPCRDADMLREE